MVNNEIGMECNCGNEIEVPIHVDGWYFLDDVGIDGCGYWEVGFIHDRKNAYCGGLK